MSSSLLFLILAALTAVGYLGGRWRAASAAQGDARRLHSRTTYHGLAVGMGAFLAGAATYVLLSFATTFMPALAGSPSGGATEQPACTALTNGQSSSWACFTSFGSMALMWT